MRRKTWLAVPDAACHKLILKGMTFGKKASPRLAMPDRIIAMASANVTPSATPSRRAAHAISAAQLAKASASSDKATGWRPPCQGEFGLHVYGCHTCENRQPEERQRQPAQSGSRETARLSLALQAKPTRTERGIAGQHRDARQDTEGREDVRGPSRKCLAFDAHSLNDHDDDGPLRQCRNDGAAAEHGVPASTRVRAMVAELE